MFSMQKNNDAYIQITAIVDALKKNDQNKVAELLKNGPADSLGWLLFNALEEGSPESIHVILNTNPAIKIGHIAAALNSSNRSTFELLLRYMTKKKLLKYADKYDAPQNIQDVAMWIQNGSSLQNLSPETIRAFVSTFFKMKNFNDELAQLLPLLKPKDFKKVFTQSLIRDALTIRNIKGFELLLPFIAQDRDLVNILRGELNNMNDREYNQAFIEKIQTLIKNETGKLPSTKKGDIKFNFSN